MLGKYGHDKREKNEKGSILINGNIPRKILGKSGRGRLGLFGFSDRYIINTWKNGKINSFNVKKTEGNSYAVIEDLNIENEAKLIDELDIIKLKDDNEKQNSIDLQEFHGTYIECPFRIA